ncbi:hypothetical protein DRA71_07445 [Neisseria meningitidis]|nr:hypothetical protein DRA71_07445 [Neisseria meningitidis]
MRRKGLRCTRCARLGRSIWACAVCSDAADSPENKPERSDAFRIVFFCRGGGGCRHIKTGGRCRLKLRHSRHFSSFPRKRESRTSNFQIMADSHLKCNF